MYVVYIYILTLLGLQQGKQALFRSLTYTFYFTHAHKHREKACRVSLRSDSDAVDVSKIAKSYGGGGKKTRYGRKGEFSLKFPF